MGGGQHKHRRPAAGGGSIRGLLISHWAASGDRDHGSKLQQDHASDDQNGGEKVAESQNGVRVAF